MSTLCVAGCSYSDRTQVTHCYGDFLSATLDKEYLHLAGGIGSNPRSTRLLTEALMANKLSAGDTVVMQITDNNRRELPSRWLSESDDGKQFLKKSKQDFMVIAEDLAQYTSPTTKVKDLNTHYDCVDNDFYVTRFKMHSHQWQQGPIDKKFHALIEHYAVYDPMDSYMLYLDLWRLNQLFAHNNIQFVVMWLRQDCKTEALGKWAEPLDQFINKQFILKDYWPEYWTPDWKSSTNQYALDPPNDSSHFSVIGHMVIADHLQRYLEEHCE